APFADDLDVSGPSGDPQGSLERVRRTRGIGELNLVESVPRPIEGDRGALVHRLARDRLPFDGDLGEAAVFVEDPEDPGTRRALLWRGERAAEPELSAR